MLSIGAMFEPNNVGLAGWATQESVASQFESYGISAKSGSRKATTEIFGNVLLFEANGDSSTYKNQWRGWYSSGSSVSKGNGKRLAYDTLPLTGVKIHDNSGKFAEYELKPGYAGRTMLSIVTEKCGLSSSSRNIGGQWNSGICSIGTLVQSGKLSGVSSTLRLGVGDGGSDSVDWALFMVLTGHGKGDFDGNNIWALGGESSTNDANPTKISLTGIRASSDKFVSASNPFDATLLPFNGMPLRHYRFRIVDATHPPKHTSYAATMKEDCATYGMLPVCNDPADGGCKNGDSVISLGQRDGKFVTNPTTRVSFDDFPSGWESIHARFAGLCMFTGSSVGGNKAYCDHVSNTASHELKSSNEPYAGRFVCAQILEADVDGAAVAAAGGNNPKTILAKFREAWERRSVKIKITFSTPKMLERIHLSSTVVALSVEIQKAYYGSGGMGNSIGSDGIIVDNYWDKLSMNNVSKSRLFKMHDSESPEWDQKERFTASGEGKLHGIWGSEVQHTSATINLPPLYPQQQAQERILRIQLRFWAIDSWDVGETGSVKANGVTLWSATRTLRACRWVVSAGLESEACLEYFEAPASSGVPDPHNGESDKDRQFFEVDVIFIVARGKTSFVLSLHASLNQASSDESWAFNRLLITEQPSMNSQQSSAGTLPFVARSIRITSPRIVLLVCESAPTSATAGNPPVAQAQEIKGAAEMAEHSLFNGWYVYRWHVASKSAALEIQTADGSLSRVIGILSFGRPGSSAEYIKTFKVEYKDVKGIWQKVDDGADFDRGQAEALPTVAESVASGITIEPMRTDFVSPISAFAIRIYPQTWNVYPAGSFALLVEPRVGVGEMRFLQQYRGAGGCEACPRGFYNDDPGTNESLHLGCIACDMGRYSESGSAVTDGALCLECDPGRFSPDGPSQSDRKTCKDCPAGFYTKGGSISGGQFECHGCPNGFFGIKRAQYNCTGCQSGRYNAQSAQDACLECQAGQYQLEMGQARCTDCRAGKYLAKTGQTSATSCKLCLNSTYSVSGSSNCPHTKKTCPAGTFGEDGGSCTVCPAGWYRLPNRRTTSCDKCPEDTFLKDEAVDLREHDSLKDCIACKIGRFSDKGSQFCCGSCPAGRVVATNVTTNRTSCRNCESGQYQSEQAKHSCDKCEAGKFQTATGSPFCLPCIPGKYNDKTGRTACKECEVGKFTRTTLALECTRCSPGMAQPRNGSANCLRCEPGKATNMSRAVECSLCHAGQFRTEAMENSQKCELCPAGRAQALKGQTGCLQCSPGARRTGQDGRTVLAATQGSFVTQSWTRSTAGFAPQAFNSHIEDRPRVSAASPVRIRIDQGRHCVPCAVRVVYLQKPRPPVVLYANLDKLKHDQV
jgi:hypothetical protein